MELKEQIEKLFEMQDELNCLIDPDWKDRDFDWAFAALAELMEIKEWLGWKWWKDTYKQGLTEENLKQVQIEVIDVLHFFLSWEIQQACNTCTFINIDEIVRYLSSSKYSGRSLTELVDTAIPYCSEYDEPNWFLFNQIRIAAKLSWEAVWKLYLGKYALNIFRQKHGYKEGTYIKNWDGQEDNQVLEGLLNAMPDLKPEEVLALLETEYAKVANHV